MVIPSFALLLFMSAEERAVHFMAMGASKWVALLVGLVSEAVGVQ